MVGTPPLPRLRLGELLVRTGHLDQARLEAALSEQRRWGGRLGRILVELGYLDERTIARALAEHLGVPSIDLAATVLPANVTDFLPVHEAEQYGVMPLQRDSKGRVLRVASSDPTNLAALDALGLRLGYRIEPFVAPPSDIDRAIRRYYYGDGRPLAAPERQAAPPGGATPPVPSPDARIARLEGLVARQGRALRILVDLLVESGGLDRAAFLRKLRGPGDGEGPEGP